MPTRKPPKRIFIDTEPMKHWAKPEQFNAYTTMLSAVDLGAERGDLVAYVRADVVDKIIAKYEEAYRNVVAERRKR